MKKEDVRSEGERPTTVYRRRFLGTVLSTPHVFISFPRHGARHGVLALDQTTCLVRFSVYFVYRSTSCRNSFDLSFPCSSARDMTARPGSSCLLYPSSRTATCIPPPR